MTPDDPRHGTAPGAMVHWRTKTPICGPCADARRIEDKRRRLDRHNGRPRMVRLGRVAADIIDRTPRQQLSNATGIRVDKLIRYADGGPSKRVHRTTRDRILRAGGAAYWTPVGIQRRLRALSALGWSMAEVSRRTGIDLDGLKRLRRREDMKFVRANVAEAIIRTYEELCMTPPTPGRSASKTRADATRFGYMPPLVWDDIDNIDESPTIGHDPKKYRRDELLAEWDHLSRAGHTMESAAARLGLTVDAIEAALYRSTHARGGAA